MDSECKWVQEEDDFDNYETECNNIFSLHGGTPEESKLEFCCYCGGKLAQILFEDEEEEGKNNA